ncbi:MAG: hypothetical protein QOD30_2257, partial [Actinomycetota bacterium]|nr:hypothetical protein [Actinomycetota bacterium]
MTLVVLATVAVAVVSGLRGAWSPCGLSMLSTITPIGERGRGNRYATTARWYVAGAAVGGLCLGAVGAVLALVSGAHGDAQLVVLVLASLLAAASDARVGGFALPTHRRQVNERWLDQYRPWVYGGGFGWQIGTGLATYITTAAVYLLVVVVAVGGDPMLALVGGLLFGVTRGLAVLLTRHVRTTDDLRRVHVAVQHAGPALHDAVLAVEVAVAIAAADSMARPLGVAALLAGGAVLTYARRHRTLVCDLDADRRL